MLRASWSSCTGLGEILYLAQQMKRVLEVLAP